MAASIGDSGPYSGEVAPGGPPDTRELAGLIVTKLAVDQEMSNNCYLLRCRATDEQVLIDAAAEPDKLRDEYGRNTAGQRFLLARRLVEAGVRMVSVSYGGWDHHDDAVPCA